jgi:ABC-type amino acid transport substrate-binding protein
MRDTLFHLKYLGIVLTVAAATACSGTNDQTKPAAPAAESAQPAAAPAPAARDAAPPVADADAPLPNTPSPFDALPDAVRQVMDKPFTGDFDALVARRVIRVGVTFNRTHYFIDAGQQRGVTYESVKLFEDELNAAQKNGNLKVNLVFVPLSRDQLYPALANGKVDLVAAMVTVTPEREKLVAFSDPTRANVAEVLVTGPGAPPIATLDDLAGKEVFIRKPSIYAESVD